jgi:hypothetical protein
LLLIIERKILSFLGVSVTKEERVPDVSWLKTHTKPKDRRKNSHSPRATPLFSQFHENNLAKVNENYASIF